MSFSSSAKMCTEQRLEELHSEITKTPAEVNRGQRELNPDVDEDEEAWDALAYVLCRHAEGKLHDVFAILKLHKYAKILVASNKNKGNDNKNVRRFLQDLHELGQKAKNKQKKQPYIVKAFRIIARRSFLKIKHNIRAFGILDQVPQNHRKLYKLVANIEHDTIEGYNEHQQESRREVLTYLRVAKLVILRPDLLDGEIIVVPPIEKKCSTIELYMHCEILLLNWIFKKYSEEEILTFSLYVGVSKLCCWLCHRMLRQLKELGMNIKWRGCHNRYYPSLVPLPPPGFDTFIDRVTEQVKESRGSSPNTVSPVRSSLPDAQPPKKTNSTLKKLRKLISIWSFIW